MGDARKVFNTLTFGVSDALFGGKGGPDPAPGPDPLAEEAKAKEEARKKAAAQTALSNKFGQSSTFKTGTAGLATDPRLRKNKLLGEN